MACEHTCGSTTGCARGGSLWNRAFAKGACVPPLFNIFFAAVVNVAYTRFKADKDIMDALMHLRKKRGGGSGGSGGKQRPESQSWRRCFGACLC